MRSYPYTDDALVGRITDFWLKRGTRLLQSHLKNNTERAQAEWLLKELDPPRSARLLDIGSGVGALAEYFGWIRPDLRFVLLNISPAQLARSNPEHLRVCADLEHLPFGADSFDGALLIFSIGYGAVHRVIGEALRVAPLVLVHDVMAADPGPWRERLFYELPSEADLARYGRPKVIEHSDGGKFEAGLPGMWAATGAKAFVLRITRGARPAAL